MKAEVGIISDDLSGGNGIGLELANFGFHTCLIQQFHFTSKQDLDVVIYDTETRLSSKEQAYQRVRQVAQHIDAPIIIKKFDSLLRGNVGVEIKAILEQQGHRHVLVLPASPKAGRTTVGGYQLVHGSLLTEEKTVDPSSAVNESHVPTLLIRDMELPVGLLQMQTIARGREELREALIELMKANSIIVADSAKQEHLNDVVSIAYTLGIRFFAGTYGLGEAIGRVIQRRRPRSCSVLTVAASLSDVTRRQVMFAAQDPRIQVVPITLPLEVSKWDAQQIALKHGEEIQKAIEDGMDVLLYTAPNKEDVSKMLLFADQSGISKEDVERKLANVIQELVKPVLTAVQGLVMTGGSTAQAVFQLLQSSGVNILPYEVVTSAPAAKVLDGPYEGMLFLTKPGAYGPENALHEMISYARLQGGTV